MIKWLIFLHLSGAAIWVGGHLILSLRYLPEALKQKNPDSILHFEKKYETIGIPALIIQVITGIWLALLYHIKWFSFHSTQEKVFSLKLILLLLTIILAIHARLVIIPRLSSDRLGLLAVHIIGVTSIAVIMVYLGISYRFGYIF